MAEESERVKQHTYQLNSNLVIQRDRSSRLEIGPSDEAKSLSAMSPEEMQSNFGNRIKRAPPPVSSKPKKPKKAKFGSTKRLRENVTENDFDFGYNPKSTQTKRIYEILLNLISRTFPAESHELIKSCADMVLELLKSDSIDLPAKKIRLEKLLKLPKGDLDEERFREFVQLSNKITDFEENQNDDRDETEIPIDFGEEEENEVEVMDEESEDEIVEIDVNDDNRGDETPATAKVVVDDDGNESVIVGDDGRRLNHRLETNRNGLKSRNGTLSSGPFSVETRRKRESENNDQSKMVLSTSSTFDISQNTEKEHEKEIDLDLKEIEAYWLQKKVSSFFKDPLEAQAKAQQVLRVMENESNERFCENKLVDLLGFEAFQLIKLLMKNRLEVVYCTKLAQSSEGERLELKKRMRENEGMRNILERLERRTSTLQDRTKRIREDLRAQAHDLRLQNAEKPKNEIAAVGRIAGCNAEESRAYSQRLNIDLESISFKTGGHTNTNKNWRLPEGSQKIQKKGYMEIYIPYKKHGKGKALEALSVSEMPRWTHESFASKKNKKAVVRLNHVQSTCYPVAFGDDGNMLLCAPTGAGKTIVAQLCMLREIGKHIDRANNKLNLDDFKIVYIAPMKSLVREMVSNFAQRFEGYGISVKELSGDQQLSQEQISKTQIIVTTPEKWDIITRKSGERAYTQLVRLVILDEIHLLHDSRGPVLEAIVARSLRQISASNGRMRLVGLSATLPNYENVEVFLRAPKENVFFFDQEFRPCPLTQCFVGLAAARPYKQMELMNQICYEKAINQRKKQQQVLIFVHSRRETFNTAKYLREKADECDELKMFLSEGSSSEAIKEELEYIKDGKLREVLAEGFAIHHAGLSAGDRRVVEDLFADRHISVLISTATLAWGVNLPAHCVIIKSTQVYSPEKGRWTELSMLDVMQMTGRAGRPGLDSYGEAFILTTQKELKYYMSLLTEQLPIESQLISKLADVLNAEIVLGTIKNMHEAIDWLTYTYLYVRMLAAPELYGVPPNDCKDDPELTQRRIDLINSAAIQLDKNRLVHYDRSGAVFQVTEFGKIAAHFYLSSETMKVFREQSKPIMSEIDILRVFSLAQEFSFVTIREEEKLEMAKLLDKVPVPIKESAEEPTAKVNVLLQTFISRLKLDGFQLQADMSYIVQSAGRLLRALFCIAAKKGWADVAKRCLTLCKCVEWRMWSVESPVRQFAAGISQTVLRRVERKEFPWERWLDLAPHEIGSFIDNTDQGKKVHRAIHSVPKVRIEGQLQPLTRSLLRIELTLRRDFEYDAAHHYLREPFWVFVEDVDGERIVHHQHLLVDCFAEEQVVSFAVPIFDPLPPKYFIRLFSDRFFGSETMLPVSLSALILPQKFPPSKELLDLTPQTVNSLSKESERKLFDFSRFNAVQTQAFSALYKTDFNALICAPPSSGKTVCAELAILRSMERNPEGKCVYIAPLRQIAEKTHRSWRRRFAAVNPEWSVALLSGDMQYDQKLLTSATILVCDALSWNSLQRRWKRRKALQTIDLFVLDEMHLLTSRKGHVFEEVVSRMRYISSQTENQPRIIGLATSVANAQDLGEWIGCDFSHIFNFAPGVRPVRLSLSVKGFDSNHFAARQTAMIKPAYAQVDQNSEGKPVLIFVPSRTLAKQVAVDFLALAEQEGKPERFVRVAEKDMQQELNVIESEFLKAAVKKGVAFLHANMTQSEKRTICALCKAQAIQVVVAERSLCWELDLQVFMVMVLGTSYYDGAAKSYVNYPIFDLLQMIGRASRPLVDSSASAVVFCEAPRREFLLKFLSEPFPVESSLDGCLADYLNAEVVNETVENIQEAVDFTTWTFLYRRLHQNPNFYNLYGTSNQHVSEFLSKLAEETLEALETAGCLEMAEKENDIAIIPLSLGHIASYYDVRFGTMEILSAMLNEKLGREGLLEVLCSAEEFIDLPVRKHEENELLSLLRGSPLKLPNSDSKESRTKAHLLLQSHFSRKSLSADLEVDREEIVNVSMRLLAAMVDILASKGWLKPALNAMELCQMVTQALWSDSPPLLQLPHVDMKKAMELKEIGVESPLDFSGEKEEEIRKLFSAGGGDDRFNDVVKTANAFPNPELTFKIEGETVAERPQKLICRVARDEDEERKTGGSDGKVSSGLVKVRKRGGEVMFKRTEAWWILIGQSKENRLLGVKRVAMTKNVIEVALEFIPPRESRDFVVFLVSDTYIGVDQEYELEINVGALSEKAKSNE